MIDGSFSGHEPDVVVFARSTDHVSQIVKYCATQKVPVIPFGTGTGLEGLLFSFCSSSLWILYFPLHCFRWCHCSNCKHHYLRDEYRSFLCMSLFYFS